MSEHVALYLAARLARMRASITGMCLNACRSCQMSQKSQKDAKKQIIILGHKLNLPRSQTLCATSHSIDHQADQDKIAACAREYTCDALFPGIASAIRAHRSFSDGTLLGLSIRSAPRLQGQVCCVKGSSMGTVVNSRLGFLGSTAPNIP